MTNRPVSAVKLRAFYVPLAIRTVKNLRTCLQRAWLDIVCHYRRSRIGPLWETINILVVVLGLSVISSAVFGGGGVTDLIGYIGRACSWLRAPRTPSSPRDQLGNVLNFI